MGIVDKIKDIEAEIARTQKNKATEAKLAKFRTALEQDPKGAKGGPGDGFDVSKTGDARVCLIGFPSVGKSTLLNKLTGTFSEVAAYEFTTLTCVSGIIEIKMAKIQLLDLPGIIEGAAQGKGRGRQVIAVAKSCDLIIIILDATKFEDQKTKLEKELETIGIRLNKQPPQIYFKIKKAGGVNVNFLVSNDIDYKTIHSVCHEYKIFHAEIIIREKITIDDLIDVIEGNRKYVKCIYLYNKIDILSLSGLKELNDMYKNSGIPVSCELGWNLDLVKQVLWHKLQLIRIYTKKKGEQPKFDEPIILSPQRCGNKVADAIAFIHKDLIKEFKFALVWGTSAKHIPQCVGLQHQLEDEDVIQIVKKR